MKIILSICFCILINSVKSQSVADLSILTTYSDDVKAQLFLYDYGFNFSQSRDIDIDGVPLDAQYYSKRENKQTNTVVLYRDKGMKYFAVQYITYSEDNLLSLLSAFSKMPDVKYLESKETKNGFTVIYDRNGTLYSFVTSASKEYAGKVMYHIAIINTATFK